MRSRSKLVLVGLAGMWASSASAELYTVSHARDHGPGSLRAALIAANGSVGIHDEIVFAIGGEGVHDLVLRSPLPPITDALVINGYSQRGARENSRSLDAPDDAAIEVSVSAPAGMLGPTFQIDAPKVILRGLIIRHGGDLAGSCGVGVFGGQSAVISGNRIEARVGVCIGERDLAGRTSSGNLIGGPHPSDRNVIGNVSRPSTGWAVRVRGDSNRIEGNYLAMSRGGVHAVQKGGGIHIIGDGNFVQHNLLPGMGPDDGDAAALVVEGWHNEIDGNQIGESFVYQRIARALHPTRGIVVLGGGANLISRNVIAQLHANPAIALGGQGYNVVVGNELCGATGGREAGGVLVGSSANQIGAPLPQANEPGLADELGNHIVGNDGYGVKIEPGAAENTLLSNRIHANRGAQLAPPSGVHIAGASGVNDGDDPGDGVQDAPALRSAYRDGRQVHVTGTLGSSPDAALLVQVFANDIEPGPPHTHLGKLARQGRVLVGSRWIPTGAGSTPFVLTLTPIDPLPTALRSGTIFLFARATRPGGATSPLSPPIALRPTRVLTDGGLAGDVRVPRDGGAQDAGQVAANDDGGAATTEVGAKGGAVTLGGARVLVPGGALSAPAALAITELEPMTLALLPPDVTQASSVYAFTPFGVRFALPVYIELPVAAHLPATQLAVYELDDLQDQSWALLSDAPLVEPGLATVRVDHLSVLVVVQKRPRPATLSHESCGCRTAPQTSASSIWLMALIACFAAGRRRNTS